METRELYKEKYEAQLREWSAKIEVMKAQTDKLTADAKIEVKPTLDAMHAKLESAKAKVHEMGEATDDKWDEVKASAEHLWGDVKASVEGAYDALKSHKPS
ncbi:MAG: coiled coil domain-containing protein [Minicystis sp.]